jgi:hypothetical protein
MIAQNEPELPGSTSQELPIRSKRMLERINRDAGMILQKCPYCRTSIAWVRTDGEWFERPGDFDWCPSARCARLLIYRAHGGVLLPVKPTPEESLRALVEEPRLLEGRLRTIWKG